MKILINEPIWKNRSVGIAIDKITEDIEVEILYKDKFGNRVFPHVYRMTQTLSLSHPIQVVRGVKLKIIPIASFKYDKPLKVEEVKPKPKLVFGDKAMIHKLKYRKEL